MANDFSGTWKNQNGSDLELSVDANGNVSGRFESGVGDGGKEYVDIVGKVLGDLITFSTAYPQYQTVISWVGQETLIEGKRTISTHWIHATNVKNSDEPEWMWYSNRIGADSFTFQN